MRVVVDSGPNGAALAQHLASTRPEVEWGTDGDGEVFLTVPYAGRDLRGRIPPGARWMHNVGAGVDGVPLDEVGDRIFTCSRGASSVAIAEYVLAAMLAFEKQIPDIWIHAPASQAGYRLGGLAGRTLGLIGIGSIGTEIAARALSFGMAVVAVRHGTDPMPLPGIERAASTDDLLGRSDHLVIAAPATPDTQHLIDGAAFRALKPGAHLVNIARGSLVDTGALVAALDNGTVAMATLDVTDPEPLPEGHPLYAHSRARITPHISWNGPTTGSRNIGIFVENLDRYLRGEPLENIVDVARGY